MPGQGGRMEKEGAVPPPSQCPPHPWVSLHLSVPSTFLVLSWLSSCQERQPRAGSGAGGGISDGRPALAKILFAFPERRGGVSRGLRRVSFTSEENKYAGAVPGQAAGTTPALLQRENKTDPRAKQC